MRFPSLLLVLGTLAGCGGQSGPTGPDLGDADLTARIDGEPFVSVTESVVRSDGVITVSATATNPTRTITFTVPDLGSATHVIGPTFAASASVTIEGKAWSAGGAAGGGSIAITTITASRIVGTLNFGLVATGGQQPNTISVTEGVFDIQF